MKGKEMTDPGKGTDADAPDLNHLVSDLDSEEYRDPMDDGEEGEPE